MKQATRTLIALAFVATCKAQVLSPVAKIVVMLKSMKTKAFEEKNAEEVQYAKFATWCKTEIAAKERDIKKGKEAIFASSADLDDNTARAEKLGMKINNLEENIEQWTKEKDEATATRKEEREAFEILHKDYSESISATSRAVKVLKKELRSQEEKGHVIALVQASNMIPKQMTNKLSSFLQGQEAARVDEPETSRITELIMELRDKFFSERTEAEKDEQQKAAAFNMLALKLSNSIKEAQASKEKKTSSKTKAESNAAKAQTDLKDAEATKADDEKYNGEVIALCAKKEKDNASRTETRQQELDAIDKAIEILTAEDVTKLLDRAEARKPSTALAALRSSITAMAGPDQVKAANYLQTMADKYSSSLLSTAALRAQKDPLAKVRKLIETLITNLKETGDAAEEKFQWCTTEITENRKTRAKTTLESEDLTAEIQSATSRINKLSQEMAELNARLADMAESLNNATAARKKEKAENEIVIADAKQAQTAVKGAIAVLKEFYEAAAKKEVFLQTEEHDKKIGQPQRNERPEIFEKAYQGGKERGVMDLLEVVFADYTNLQSSTEQNEKDSQKAYDDMKAESDALKADLEKDHDDKNTEKVDTMQTRTIKNRDLDAAQDELSAAKTYFEKLKKDCLDNGPSHEEKEARRQEEIASLKNALAMLNSIEA
eukprot:TRINITY_DN587_c0_g1_i2.p1 TRINITY_DN587_c0_g1~~TRINITY_DN587_c0_g1_i2.p1  ORF type:complete len:666 (-),score=249.94 TRINITY_DN587_c0_g1_i2:87-2084(-)